VCRAKRRHQSPEWTILSHINCFIQGEVIRFQVLLHSLHPRSTRTFWWFPPVIQWEAVKVLASVSSGIHTVWLDREKRLAWKLSLIGCPSHLVIPYMVVCLITNSFLQTPLVESINLQYITLGDCPALRAIQEDR